MPFTDVTKFEQRRELVELMSKPGVNRRELCRRYGVSPTTGYKWLDRYEAEGTDGLRERSRRPLSSPNKTPSRVERMVLEVRRNNSTWGGRKIRARLDALGLEDPPAPSTITRILERHGKLREYGEYGQSWTPTRFERAEPNELWQIDFKSPMVIGGEKYHPLTVLDDRSRFSLCSGTPDNKQTETIKGELTGVFSRYGLPRTILADNGVPWGSSYAGHNWTQLGVWLMRLGVEIIHSRPYHPETLGKAERYHRTLDEELLNFITVRHREQLGRELEQFRHRYNFQRPHEALELKTPAEVYRPSERGFPGRLREPEYGEDDAVRTASGPSGSFKFKNHRCFLGEPFQGMKVAVRPTLEDGVYDVYFLHRKIKQIDLNEDVTR